MVSAWRAWPTGAPQDAAKFFSAAVAAHPDYAPALLNLATVERQYLHDDAPALENYRAYLALTPHPADWDAVNDLVKNLEQPKPVAAVKAPPAKENRTGPAREAKGCRDETAANRCLPPATGARGGGKSKNHRRHRTTASNGAGGDCDSSTGTGEASGAKSIPAGDRCFP